MRRFLWVAAVAIGLFISQQAEAATCTCPSGTTCNIQGADADWTEAGCDAAGPTGADDVIVQSGGTLSLNASTAVNTIEVQSGGTAACVNDATARTITVNSTKAGPNAGGTRAWIWIRAGGTLDCDGATGVEGVATTFAYDGTIVTTEAAFFVGDGTSSNLNPTTDAIMRYRGLARGTGNVENVGAGATDDFVWCADFVGPTSYAVGDTVVFTSGRLDEFWCRVDALASAGTAECNVTACGGGACDVEIDCNDAGAGFKSFTLATTVGGPVRAAVPTDCDGNGTADNDCAYPVNGDAVTVFKPALITGVTAAPVTDGPMLEISGAQLNVRYLDVTLTGSLPTAQSCTNVGSNCGGYAAIAFFVTASIAPENDIAYINLYDYASQNGIELNETDRISDSRPNYAPPLRHVYIHDPSATVEACTCGIPDAASGGRMGEGIVGTNDQVSGAYNRNRIVEGVHIARIYSVPFSWSDISQTQDTGLTFQNFLIHDIPKTTTYGNDNLNVFSISQGKDTVARGIHIWDIGNLNDDPQPVTISATATAPNPDEATGIRLQNFYVVNWDNNTGGAPADSSDAAISLAGNGALAQETANVVISNSYIANIQGQVGNGGTWRYNFISNPWLDDTGATTCDTGVRRGTLRMPAEETGSVHIRTSNASCSPTAIMLDIDANGVMGAYHLTGARKYLSNLWTEMNSEPAGQEAACVYMKYTAGTEVVGLDVYNNICDLKNEDANGEYGILRNPSTAATTVSTNTFYNVVMNSTGSAAWTSGSMPQNHGYNRYFRIANAGMFAGGLWTLNADETDSDAQNFLAGSADQNQYGFLCGNLRNPWGGPIGPLAFGIRDFSYFHPAALAAMDANVWKLRYNWLMCSGANQDAVPR